LAVVFTAMMWSGVSINDALHAIGF
jgi:hypothetical protein